MAEVIVTQLQPKPCKYCDSKRTRRYGHSKENKQRWLCNDCHHTFLDNDAQPRMKTSPSRISAAVAMFFEGLSLAAIQRQLEQIYGDKPSDGAIYSWIVKYSEEAVSKAKDYKPNVGDVWLCDETVLKVGGQNVWFYDVIDTKTRFLLASHLTDRRYLGDARIVLAKAGKEAGKKPKAVITDSLPAYPQAIGDVFGADVRHIRYKGITKEPNNNVLERFHGSLKARTKVMRGLKSMESAKLFTDAWLVFYNYLRPHESLADETPAHKAGVSFPYHNWLEVVGDSESKIASVTWATKLPPFLRQDIPPSLKRELGISRKLPKELRGF